MSGYVNNEQNTTVNRRLLSRSAEFSYEKKTRAHGRSYSQDLSGGSSTARTAAVFANAAESAAEAAASAAAGSAQSLPQNVPAMQQWHQDRMLYKALIDDPASKLSTLPRDFKVLLSPFFKLIPKSDEYRITVPHGDPLLPEGHWVLQREISKRYTFTTPLQRIYCTAYTLAHNTSAEHAAAEYVRLAPLRALQAEAKALGRLSPSWANPPSRYVVGCSCVITTDGRISYHEQKWRSDARLTYQDQRLFERLENEFNRAHEAAATTIAPSGTVMAASSAASSTPAPTAP